MIFLNKTQQLEKTLRTELNSGIWTVGSKLPSEDDMMNQFGASRPSMREALNTLVSEGIIARRHGSGTYLLRKPCNRIEVLVRLENIASTSGYWFRSIVMELQSLARTSGYALELITGFGNTQADFYRSLERRFCQPNATDLMGVISLIADTHIDEFLRQQQSIPVAKLNFYDDGFPHTVILDYEALAKSFKTVMTQHGIQEYTLFAVNDPDYKMSVNDQDFFRHCYDLITDSTSQSSVMFDGDAREREHYNDYVENLVMGWYQSPKRTRAAIFFDDGLFTDCYRVLCRHHIRVPQDVAVLTHANIGRDFESVLPDRIGFSPCETARKLWQTLLGATCESVEERKLLPIVQEGETLVGTP